MCGDNNGWGSDVKHFPPKQPPWWLLKAIFSIHTIINIIITTSTSPSQHHHLNTATSTPPPQHHHLSITISTPPPQHHHLNITTSTQQLQHHHLHIIIITTVSWLFKLEKNGYNWINHRFLNNKAFSFVSTHLLIGLETSTYSPQPSTPSPQPSTPSPQPSTHSPHPSTHSPHPSTHSPHPSSYSPHPSTHSTHSPQPSTYPLQTLVSCWPRWSSDGGGCGKVRHFSLGSCSIYLAKQIMWVILPPSFHVASCSFISGDGAYSKEMFSSVLFHAQVSSILLDIYEQFELVGVLCSSIYLDVHKRINSHKAMSQGSC